MLTNLNLRDFVIVDSMHLDVRSGFTVLTGETGAGKSILIDALELILGGRSDPAVVREGTDKADISAEFSLTPSVSEWLKEQEIEACDGMLLVRRTIDTKGRSRAWINGIVVSVTQLRALGELLVDVHGQHSHQSLLKSDCQLALLDAHAEAVGMLAVVESDYEAWRRAHDRLVEATANQQEIEEKAERLRWAIEDLEALSPEEGEWEKLNADHTRMAHGVSIAEGLQEGLEGLTESEQSASSVMSSVHAKLTSLSRYDERLSEIADTLSAGIDLAEEAAHEITKYLDRNDFDEETFERLDRRVSQYFDLARKFRVEPEGLHALLEGYRGELADLTSAKDVEGLKKAEKAALERYEAGAAHLTELRCEAAKELGRAVTEQMQDLAMVGACFEVKLIANEPSSKGLEHCEFWIAGHAGVQTRPLVRVASGGELARISLAIAVITARSTPVPTLIFDEVDSGIGGAVAEVVGMLLRRLGKDRQVLCVTHLPQVASCGDNHWKVEKHLIDGRTLSQLSVLTDDKRKWEIARMLTGIEITQNALDVADEMLSR